jgi:hypothetical protein
MRGLIQYRNVVVGLSAAVSALVQDFPFSYDPGRGGTVTASAHRIIVLVVHNATVTRAQPCTSLHHMLAQEHIDVAEVTASESPPLCGFGPCRRRRRF